MTATIDKIDKIVFGRMIDVTVAAGIISYEGNDKINVFMRSLGIPELPDWWDWHTFVPGKGEYVGSFCKRVAKYYWQMIQYKISSDNLGILGSIMSNHTFRDNQYSFDFTGNFDWEAGDFGDDGSCFWACHMAARELLQDYGVFAIRFYDESKGYARAWVCREGDCYVMFNGYGLECSNIARIMADYLGMSYRKITLDNQGESSGLIWINGGAGYIVGPESSVNGVSHVRLDIDVGTVCVDCGCVVDEDNSYLAGDVGVICETCYCDDYFRCEDCEEITYNESCCEVSNSDFVCVYCRDSNYTECDDCNEYHRDDEVIEIDGRNVCQGCFGSGEYSICDDCGIKHHDSAFLMFDGICICENCIEQYMCSNCREPNSDMVEVDGELICPDCIEKVEVD